MQVYTLPLPFKRDRDWARMDDKQTPRTRGCHRNLCYVNSIFGGPTHRARPLSSIVDVFGALWRSGPTHKARSAGRAIPLQRSLFSPVIPRRLKDLLHLMDQLYFRTILRHAERRAFSIGYEDRASNLLPTLPDPRAH